METDVNPYVAIASALLVLVGFYFPGFSGWFEKQTKPKKQLVMLGALAIVVAVQFGLGCIGRDSTYVCDPNGAFDALVQFIYAIAINAGVYKAINYTIAKPAKEPPAAW